MTSAAISGQTTSYGWDALNRQVTESGPLGTLTRTFDLDSRRTGLTYPDGRVITYAYDAASEVTAISDGSISLAQYGYDDLGRRLVIQRPGVAATNFSYGSDLHLANMTLSYVDTSKNETYGFWYNAAGQVRSSTSSNMMYDWGSAGVGRNYAVDGQNRYTTAGSANYKYDGRANLSSDGVNTFAYDVTNRLTSLSNGANLSYDAPGRLFQTTGSSTTRFLYDGDQIVGEYDGSGTLLRRYVPGPNADEPIVWYEGAGTTNMRWLLADRQGSIVAVANSSGTTIGIDTYDESGIPGSGNIGRFQYDGMAWVPEAGLYHDRARAYSPTLGRFMQSDPIGYGDGMNFFNFAHGDPVNGSDPSGLSLLRGAFILGDGLGLLQLLGGDNGNVGDILSSLVGNMLVEVTVIGQRPPAPRALPPLTQGVSPEIIPGYLPPPIAQDISDPCGMSATPTAYTPNGDSKGENPKLGSGGYKTDLPGGYPDAEAVLQGLGRLAGDTSVVFLPFPLAQRSLPSGIQLRVGGDGRPRIDIPAN